MSIIAGRNSGFAVHIDDSDAAVATNLVKAIPASQQRVFSGYFRAAAAPSTNSTICTVFDTGGALIARARVDTGGTLTVQCIDGLTATGAVVTDNAWHLLDMWVDSSALAGTWLVQWALDEVAGALVTSASGKVSTSSASIGLGSGVTTHTAVVDWDDCVGSVIPGVFPIGPHSVGAIVPTSDGSYTQVGTNVVEADTGQDIGVGLGQVTAYNRMDEWPANTTDYVRQVTNGTSNYAEVNFADTVASSIWGVSAVAALFASGTAADTGTTRIVDSSDVTLVDVYAGDMSQTSLHYRTAIIPVPAGGWTPAVLNGLKARVGFSSDTSPNPRWSALMLQYAIPEANAQSLEDMVLISRTPTVFILSTLLHPKATVGLISRVGVLFAPKFQKKMLLPLINQAGVVFAPAQYTQKVIDAGAFEQGAFDDDTFQHGASFYISSTVEVFAPEFPANPQTVTLGVDSAFQDDAFQDNAFQDSASIGGSIIRTGTPFAPQVTGQAVSAYVYLTGTGGWDSGEITWDDAVAEWDAAGLGGQINQSGHVFTPQFQFTKVLLDLIDQSAVLFTPSPGASSFGPLPFINRSGFTYTPEKVTESITVGLISQVGTTFTPVVQAPQTVDLDLIDQTPVLFEFQLNPQELELPFINRAGFTYTPERVTEQVDLDLIASTVAVFAPKLDAIALPFISQTPVVFEPVNVIFNAPDVELDLIDQTPVVFEPPLFLIPFQQTVRLDETAEQFIDNTGHVFQFVSVEVAQPQSVFIGFIDQRGVALQLRVFIPTRPTIVLHARYDPVSVKHARYDPVILKHAQNTRQG
jgi:hypothetical protein